MEIVLEITSYTLNMHSDLEMRRLETYKVWHSPHLICTWRMGQQQTGNLH